jgi:membrane protein required for colicin V production
MFVSPFDIAVGLVLVVSGLIALIRGATREITTVIAFLLAVFIALYGLRFTGPIAQHAISTGWIASAVAALVTFIAAYIVLRVIGGAITRRVQQTAGLSSLDRILGLAIGLVRGAVVVAAVTLLINAATPPERLPAWIAKARLYPAATMGANALRALAPEGLRMAHSVGPAVRDAVAPGLEPSQDAKSPAKPRSPSPQKPSPKTAPHSEEISR